VFIESSDRLGNLKPWIAVATLRASDIIGVPDDYTAEPLDSMSIIEMRLED
jgi:hypothetical protein